MVSVVDPIAPRKCIGKNIQIKPRSPHTASRIPVKRKERLVPADSQTPIPNAIKRGSYRKSMAIQSGLVGAPIADSSLML